MVFNAAMMANRSGCSSGVAGAGVEGASTTQWLDTADSNAPITRLVTVDDLGAPTVQWLDKTGNILTDSPSFVPATVSGSVTTSTVFATNTLAGDADLGEIIEVERHDTFVDNVLQIADTVFLNMNVVPAVDLTAVVGAAPYELSAYRKRVHLGEAAVQATGGGIVFLAAPSHSQYAEVYIDADDSGIRWTKNGSAPADNNGEQDNAGSTIELHGAGEIADFAATSIDGSGALDAAGTANLTVNFWNIAPDKS